MLDLFMGEVCPVQMGWWPPQQLYSVLDFSIGRFGGPWKEGSIILYQESKVYSEK